LILQCGRLLLKADKNNPLSTARRVVAEERYEIHTERGRVEGRVETITAEMGSDKHKQISQWHIFGSVR
jgi:hypothetical protein